MSGRRAFTLIELLLVIAIIAILATLVVAAASRGLKSAKSVKCRSNVRQIGLGVQLYVTESGSFPQAEANNSAGTDDWVATVARQISSDKLLEQTFPGDMVALKDKVASVFRCPSRPTSSGAATFFEPVAYGYNYRSYADQGLIRAATSGPGAAARSEVRESEIVAPSDMICVGDSMYRSGKRVAATTFVLERTSRLNDITPEGDKFARQFHSNRANIGFCDGHVEQIKLQDLFFDDSDQALRRWNRDHLPHRDLLY